MCEIISQFKKYTRPVFFFYTETALQGVTMEKFGVFFVAIFLFVNVQSGSTGADWAENLRRNLENHGRLIEQQAKKYAEEVVREQNIKQVKFQEERDDIMETVKQIQAGTIPSGVNSANTTSLTENVNGKVLTIKTTIYSTGSETSRIIHSVQAVYEGATVIDLSINSIMWNGNQLKKKLFQYSPESGNNNFSYNNYGGGIISTSGGSTITSINGGGIIVQK